MMYKRLLPLALLMAWAQPALADCNAIRTSAQTASELRDVTSLRQLYRQSGLENCAELQKWIGRHAAEAIYNQATARDPVDEPMLLASLDFGRSWQALATLGDLANARRDYASAATRYQEALVEIADANATPSVPPTQIVLAIRRQAEQAALLSPRYVPSARGRDGTNAGLAAMQIRGIEVAAVALPIQFKFDSIDFTQAGIDAVADLGAILKADQHKLGRVTLIGHTDATGDADYNQRLSVRRAQAVRDYLRAHGINADIQAEGRGESEPYQPDDPGRYSQDERDQMSRRVELRRK